jgi:hypothetical protein
VRSGRMAKSYSPDVLDRQAIWALPRSVEQHEF